MAETKRLEHEKFLVYAKDAIDEYRSKGLNVVPMMDALSREEFSLK